MILITGAAGKTGNAIINKLIEKNEKVKAWIYKESYSTKLKDIGITEFVIGDMKDKELWKQALENVNAIYHICPNMSVDEVEIGKIAISVADASDSVRKFVYHSVVHPQIRKMPHHWNKLRVEELLFESVNLKWTILQPTAYMQNILAYWNQIINKGFYELPYPSDTKISLVDLNDVAEIAVKVLTEPSHSNAIYELIGEESLSQKEIAKIIGDKLKKDIYVKELSLNDWKEKMQTSNMNPEQLDMLVQMFDYYKHFNLSGNSNVLKWLLNRPPNSFKNWL